MLSIYLECFITSKTYAHTKNIWNILDIIIIILFNYDCMHRFLKIFLRYVSRYNKQIYRQYIDNIHTYIYRGYIYRMFPVI